MRLKDEKQGVLWVERVGVRRSWAILAQNSSWKMWNSAQSTEK